jgi:phage gp36-like protein
MAYATQADLLTYGFPSSALGTLTVQQITTQLQSASEFADSFFRARWGATAVPLVAWDSTVTEAVAKIAALRLLKVRGYSPNSTADQQFRQGYDDAIEWLDKVQRQQAHPLVTLASTGVAGSVQPQVVSSSVVDVSSGRSSGNRGW